MAGQTGTPKPGAPTNFATGSENPSDPPEQPNDPAPKPDDETTAEKFADQPQLVEPAGPYVRFTRTEEYTHKQIDIGDLKLANLTPPEGFSSVEWNALNGFHVPTSVFGAGGKSNPIVARLLADPANEFEYVESLEPAST